MRLRAAAVALPLLLLASPLAAQPFSYLPPGDLAPGSGEGREDYTVYAPGMLFPIEVPPAFVNSQVWGYGGSQGPGGSQCDVANYSYPWRDNYCEERTWTMPLCPAGTGHQGVDMRPSTCDNNTHWAVAAVDGTITHIGSWSVYLTAEDGTRYDYLHMSNVQVAETDTVTRGQRLGYVSNVYGGTPTTIHLHFNLFQNVDGVGDVYVPPYMSLIEAYQRLINQPPQGELDEPACTALTGWAADPDAPDALLDVLLSFDGELGDPAAQEVAVLADQQRAEPCQPPESCAHGFELPAPFGLFDGEPHDVHAYALDADIDVDVELDGSPTQLSCEPPTLSGFRRPVSSAAMSHWAFSAFQDVLEVDAATLSALPLSVALGQEPVLVTNEAASSLWVIDGAVKRSVADDAAARAWRFDASSADVWSAAEIAEVPSGPALRARPTLLTDDGVTLFLLDDDVDSGAGGGGAGPGSGPAGIPGEDGCSCRQTPAGHSPAWLGLALAVWLGVVARRRARRPRRAPA